MNIQNDMLAYAVHGYRFAEEDDGGYLKFYRFSHELIENHFRLTKDFYDRCRDTAGMVMKFQTDAGAVSFDYRLDWINGHDSIDVYVNGSMCSHFPVYKDNAEGKFEFICGNRAEERGVEREIWIYFPNYARMSVKNFEAAGASVFRPGDTSCLRRVLILGDSITQGSSLGWSSLSYANTVSRLKKWESVNLGIGGYSFYADGLEEQPFYPELILVALGTNGNRNPAFPERVSAYFEKLHAMYPDVPVLVISPVYRATMDVEHVHEIIKERISGYANITLVNGFSFVPHLPEFYADGVHPNLAGSGYLAAAVADAVEKIPFGDAKKN